MRLGLTGNDIYRARPLASAYKDNYKESFKDLFLNVNELKL